MVADVYHLRTWLWLPAPRERVFAFFADAHNLERITPRFLAFRVLNTEPIQLAAGAHIDYRLRLHGLPLRWRTAITIWDPPTRFRDTQVRGPYREWVHTHDFEDEDEGTRVTDHVRYRLPGPPIASHIVNALLVGPDTRRIFEFRHTALAQAFDAERTAKLGPVTIDRLSGPRWPCV